MGNALFSPPPPVNEPVYMYSPGSPEKQAVKATLKELQDQQADIPLVIGSQKIIDRPTEDLTSPQNHSRVLAKFRQATADDINQAISAATKVGPEWAALPWNERAAVFLKTADLIATKYRPIMNATTLLGQGKTIFQAEIDAACELIDFLRYNVAYAHQIYSQQPYSSHGVWNRSEARGLEGFVFAVGPFNFTAISGNLAASPALMGTPVIWKPASTALLSSYMFYQIMEEAGLPPGVINLVTGDPKVIGATCLASEHLSGIHFTGSTGTFNYLWQEVGKNIGR